MTKTKLSMMAAALVGAAVFATLSPALAKGVSFSAREETSSTGSFMTAPASPLTVSRLGPWGEHRTR